MLTKMKKPLILLLLCGCMAITTIVYFTDVGKFDMYGIINDVADIDIDDMIGERKSEKAEWLNYSLTPDIRPHGNLLCVWWNFTKSTDIPDENDATLSTHGTVGYSKFVFDHVERWNGFISAALSVDDTQFPALVAYMALYKCHPEFEKILRTHIVWWKNNRTCDSEYVLTGMEEAAGNLTNIEGCNLADYDKIFKASRMSTIYKANAMRNIARIGAQTDIQLIADIENHFCDNASIIASKFADAVRNGTVVVVRRFEYSDTVEVPRNVTELDALLQKKLANELHHFVFERGHTVPRLQEWLNYSMTPENPPDLDPVKYRGHEWEPQLIVHRSHPYHYERVPFGYSDQAALPHEVCRAGIPFNVGSHIFSGHRSIRRRGYSSRTKSEGNADYAKKMAWIYEKALDKKYPNSTTGCGRWP